MQIDEIDAVSVGEPGLVREVNEPSFILDDIVIPTNDVFFTSKVLEAFEGKMMDFLSLDVNKSVSSPGVEMRTGSIGKIDEAIDAHMTSLSPSTVNRGSEVGAGSELQPIVDLVNDIYLSSTKMKCAWQVVFGLSKDIKMMLQAQ